MPGLFAQAGAIVAGGDRNVDGARETTDAILRNGGKAASFALDLTKPDSIDAFTRAVAGEFGAPDIIASIAGWDSLAHIGLMFSLEAEFGVTFTDNELSLLDNVGQLRKVIAIKLPD